MEEERSMLGTLRTGICCALFFLAALVQAQSQVPPLVSFSGNLADAAGKPLTGAQAVTFSIYSERDSHAPLWQETQNVAADEQGRYTVHLGAATATGMPLDLFTSGQSLWLGVQPQTTGVPEQSRVLLVSAPYALKAADAETLGGKPASAFVTREAVSAPGGESIAAVSGNTRTAQIGPAS